jgi:hypothetical protein
LQAGPPAKKNKKKSWESDGAEEAAQRKLTMTTVDLGSVAQYGLTVNQTQRFHQHAVFYSIEKKLEVAGVRRSHKPADDSWSPNHPKLP